MNRIYSNATQLRLYGIRTLAILAITLPSGVGSQAEDVVGYDQVKDILRKRCVTCHNPDEMRGDLDLKDLTAIRAGSSSGDVVVAGDPSASLLYTTVAHLDDPAMPPNSPQIPAREQDLILRWIAGGLATRTGPDSEMAGSVPKLKKGASDVPSNIPGSEANTATENLSQSRGPEGSSPIGFVAIRPLPQSAAIIALDAHPTRDLAVINGFQQAVFFQPSTGKQLGAVDVAEGDVTAVRFTQDGKLLMVAAGQAALSGSVVAFDVDSGNRVWQVGDENDSILAFDLAPDGRTLAVGGPSKTVRLYEVPDGREIRAFKKHTDWVLEVRFSPDGQLLASSDRFGGIFVWDPKQGSLFNNLKDHVGAVHSLAWEANSETLISGGEDGKLRTWNLHDGALTNVWDANVGPVLALACGPNYVAAAGRKGPLKTWSQPDVLAANHELTEQVEALALCSADRHLIVGDSAGQVTILNASDLSPAASLRLPIDSSLQQQLLARLDRAEQDFAAELAVRQEQLARKGPTADSIVPMRVESANEPKSNADDPRIPGPGKTTLNVLLTAELESNRQQLAHLEEALQQSNQTLSAMAESNEQLVELLRRSSRAQALLAQHISQQVQMLEMLRSRSLQFEEALRSSGRVEVDVSILATERAGEP